MPKTVKPAPIFFKNCYRLQFSFKGKQYRRYLIKDKRLAYVLQSRVNNRILEFKYGIFEIPPNTSLPDFIFSSAVDKPDSEVNDIVSVVYLSQLITIYEKTLVPPNKAASTCRTEKIHLRHLKKFIKYKSHNPQLDQIHPKFFLDYKEYRRSKEVITDTVKKELASFQMMFSFAIQSGYAQSNVVKDVKRDKSEKNYQFRTTKQINEKLKHGNYSPKEIKEIKRYRYLNPTEIQELISLAENNWLQPILVVFSYTGGRRGEVMKLSWEDIDFQRNTLKLKSAKQSNTKKEVARYVPMTPKLKEVLLKQKSISVKSNWVFPGTNGNQISMDTLRSAFLRLIKNTTFEGIGFHCLRHSFASNLASASVDPRVVGNILGHTTEAMREHYQHIFPEQKEDAIEKLYELYKKKEAHSTQFSGKRNFVQK